MDNTLCACGCGEVMSPFDKKGRPRKYIMGHVARVAKYDMIHSYTPPKEKQCTKCGETKAIDEFYFKTYTSKTTGEKYRRYRPECMVCSKKHTTDYIADNSELVASKKKEERQIRKSDIRFHVQNKISTWRKASIVPSDLTVDYLVDIYNQQDGYCYYSREPMIFGWVDGKVHHNSLSLDKLDPAKGYVQGNVVWCTYLVNTMKQNMTERQFYDAISKIFDTTYGVAMSIEISIADKLRKITTKAKLGDLPKVIEKNCAEEAEKGKRKHTLYFRESESGGTLPFYGSLGPAYKEIAQELRKPCDRKITMTKIEFIETIRQELESETGLKITFIPFEEPNPNGSHLPPVPANSKHYQYSVSVVLIIEW